MQNAKDTFFATLRDRLATVNPARTTSVRGVTRPAVVVDENELPDRAPDTGVFHLAWGARTQVRGVAPAMDVLECRITYCSAGEQQLSTLARGREVDDLDRELSAILTPAHAPKQSFSASGSATLETNIFWWEMGPRDLKAAANTLERTATVMVAALHERGEA